MNKLKRAKRIMQIVLGMFFSLFFCDMVFSQYKFDNWTTDEGLPQNSVEGIIQAKNGYIWGVTRGGIIRFDGVRFKVFNKSNIKKLNESRFITISEDGEGSLWFLSESGNSLVKYNDGMFRTFSVGDGLEEKITGRTLLLDKNAELVFNTLKGAYKYHQGKFVRVSIPTVKDEDFICHVDKDGGVWVNGKKGLRRIVDGKSKSYDLPNSGGDLAPGIYEDRFGNFWIYIDSWLYRIYRGNLQKIASFNFGKPIIEDKEGNLWIGYYEGLYKIDADKVNAGQIDLNKFQKFTTAEGLPDNSITSLATDSEGGVWAGTYNSGLILISPQPIRVFSKAEWGTKDDIVYPILEDSRKNIWLGIWSKALIKYDLENNFRIFDPSPIGNSPSTLFEDSKERLWIGTVGNIGYLQDERFTKIPREKFNNIALNYTVINEDENNFIWIGTEQSLIRFKDQENITIYGKKDGLPDPGITSFLRTAKGKFWVGTKGGLALYLDGKFTSFTDQEDLNKDHIRSLYEDAEGVLWIGTYDAGLIRYKNSEFKRITKEDGMFNENVFCTLEDQNGWFWINSNNGIYRVRKQQINDFLDGKTKRVESIAYNKKDGLLNVEGNGGKQPAGIRRSNGELWFPTQEGVAIVDPKQISINLIPPPVHIEEIFIDKEDIGNYGDIIEVQPEQENLEINYTGLSLINSELVKFRYRLEGLETDWNDVGTRRTAFYNNLPPGEYTFQVIAANRDGVWNNEGATIKIVKIPHFYQTWWFLVLSVLTIIGIISYIFYTRISKFREIAKAKTRYSRQIIESQEDEKKRLAAELHDGLGQELIIIKNRAMLAANEVDNKEALTKEIEHISSTVAQALTGVREITNNLRPQLLDRLGLTKALKSMVKKVSGIVEIEEIIDPIDNLVSKKDEINIYRIVQESINNVIKHSDATNALVEIKQGEKNIKIIIKDNGKGFDSKEVQDQSVGLGLVGIKERTQLLGGKFFIDSKIGEGTTIEIEIPL